jgi:hypothetical protein
MNNNVWYWISSNMDEKNNLFCKWIFKHFWGLSIYDKVDWYFMWQMSNLTLFFSLTNNLVNETFKNSNLV